MKDLLGKDVWYMSNNHAVTGLVCKIITERTLNTGSTLHGKFMPTTEKNFILNNSAEIFNTEDLFLTKEDLLASL